MLFSTIIFLANILCMWMMLQMRTSSYIFLEETKGKIDISGENTEKVLSFVIITGQIQVN